MGIIDSCCAPAARSKSEKSAEDELVGRPSRNPLGSGPTLIDKGKKEVDAELKLNSLLNQHDYAPIVSLKQHIPD